MQVLLSGASGFVGRHILGSCQRNGLAVTPITRKISPTHEEVSFGAPIWSKEAIAGAVERTGADLIVHCGGVTHAGTSRELFEANTLPAAALIDALNVLKRPPRVIFVGSAAEYGNVPEHLTPVEESYPCAPVSEYGISKYAQTLLSLSAANRGLQTLVVRISNPVGLGMPVSLSLPSFARRICEAAPGSEISVGNLDVARDFIDVSEVARIMTELIRCPNWPWRVVNVCSGMATPIASVLKLMLSYDGRGISTKIDPVLQRPGEMTIFSGSTARLRSIGISPSSPNMHLLSGLLIDEVYSRMAAR